MILQEGMSTLSRGLTLLSYCQSHSCSLFCLDLIYNSSFTGSVIWSNEHKEILNPFVISFRSPSISTLPNKHTVALPVAVIATDCKARLSRFQTALALFATVKPQQDASASNCSPPRSLTVRNFQYRQRSAMINTSSASSGLDLYRE